MKRPSPNPIPARVPRRGPALAFSLTEVVLALGIFAFAIVALLGLLTVALSSSAESGERLAAANVAAEIIGRRRASPSAEISNFVLPPIHEITAVGSKAAESNAPGQEIGPGGFQTQGKRGDYLCVYRLWKESEGGVSEAAANSDGSFRVVHVHLRLSWPVDAAKNDSPATKHFEIKTAIALQ